MAEERIVTITVLEKAEQKDGWKVTGDVPQFQTKFPVVFTRVPGDQADQLKPGQTHNVKIIKGRLKDKKDGSWETDYWWEWGGITEQTAPTPTNGEDRQRAMQIGSAQHSAAMCVAALFDETPSIKTLTEAVERLTVIFDEQARRLASENRAPESTERPPKPETSGTPKDSPAKEAFAAEVKKRWPNLDLATIPDILGMHWPDWVESHNGDVAWASKQALAKIGNLATGPHAF